MGIEADDSGIRLPGSHKLALPTPLTDVLIGQKWRSKRGHLLEIEDIAGAYAICFYPASGRKQRIRTKHFQTFHRRWKLES